MDHNGLADPYVKLHLLPGASKVSAFFSFMYNVRAQPKVSFFSSRFKHLFHVNISQLELTKPRSF